MNKLFILNVLAVVLVVYVSAKYTYQNGDAGELDEEIDTIARALDALKEVDERDTDVDCFDLCDADCNCAIEECEYICDGKREFKARATNGMESSFIRRRWRRRRIRRRVGGKK